MKSSEISTVRTFRNEPRRRFTVQYKRELVEMVLASPLSLARVAREHDLNHNQLARWRREYERGKYAINEAKDAPLLAVRVDEMAGPPANSVAAARSLVTREAGVSVQRHLPKGKVVVSGVDEHQLRGLIEAMQ